jgi:hypothetical protein
LVPLFFLFPIFSLIFPLHLGLLIFVRSYQFLFEIALFKVFFQRETVNKGDQISRIIVQRILPLLVQSFSFSLLVFIKHFSRVYARNIEFRVVLVQRQIIYPQKFFGQLERILQRGHRILPVIQNDVPLMQRRLKFHLYRFSLLAHFYIFRRRFPIFKISE